MPISIQFLLLTATTFYQLIASVWEDRQPPLGQMISVGQHQLHFYVAGEGSPTIVLDHSLGGIEGTLLVDELSQLTRVCVYDRAGYGWSEHSPLARTSQQIVQELDMLLTQAGIEPPYILVGDSFGTYNVRLYAHQFPHKVMGVVLTDGLHETGMLQLPLSLKGLQLFFISGFVMSTLGSMFGIIRILKGCKIFELFKPELRHFSDESLNAVKRSFCRPKHWITMIREMINLEASARQLCVAQDLGELPIVSIKADSFFKPSWWTYLIPLKHANELRDRMHVELCKLSCNCLQVEANESGHFVWIDQPDVIVAAVKTLLKKVDTAS